MELRNLTGTNGHSSTCLAGTLGTVKVSNFVRGETTPSWNGPGVLRIKYFDVA